MTTRRLRSELAKNSIACTATHFTRIVHHLELIAFCAASHGTEDQDTELREIGAIGCELIEPECTQRRWYLSTNTVGVKSQPFQGLHISQGIWDPAIELVVV